MDKRLSEIPCTDSLPSARSRAMVTVGFLGVMSLLSMDKAQSQSSAAEIHVSGDRHSEVQHSPSDVLTAELTDAKSRDVAFARVMEKVSSGETQFIVRDGIRNIDRSVYRNSDLTTYSPFVPEEELASGHESLLQDVASGLTGQEEVIVRHVYDTLPYVAVAVTNKIQARKLVDAPTSLAIYSDEQMYPSDERVVNLLQAPAAWEQGATGGGYHMVFLGTGIDNTHPAFQGRVADRAACYGSTNSSTTSLCDGGKQAVDGGMDVGKNCDPQISGCDHETMVAGSAIYSAYGASVLSIKTVSIDKNGGISTYSSDFLKALDWVMKNRLRVSVVNFSWGGGAYTEVCNKIFPHTQDALLSMVKYGASMTIASGNESYINATAEPGCITGDNYVNDGISTVVSTTIQGDDMEFSDLLSYYSNVAFWSLGAAPAENIITTSPGNKWKPSAGTSMAAGVWSAATAIMRSADHNATPGEIENMLLTTGVPIRDLRISDDNWNNGLSVRRADMKNALEAYRVKKNPFAKLYMPNADKPIRTSIR